MPGVLEEVDRRGDLAQLAKVHDGDAARDVPHQAEVVGDEEVGEIQLLPEPEEEVDDLPLHGDVQGGGRLVEEDERRIRRQRPRDRDHLLLPPPDRLRVLVQVLVRRKLDHLQEGLHPRETVVARPDPMHLQGHRQDLLDGALGVERRAGILKDDPQIPFERPRSALERHPNGFPLEPDLPCGGRVHADDALSGRRLPRAGLPDQAEGVSRGHVEGDVVDRSDQPALGGEVLLQVHHVKDALGHRHHLRYRKQAARWDSPTSKNGGTSCSQIGIALSQRG